MDRSSQTVLEFLNRITFTIATLVVSASACASFYPVAHTERNPDPPPIELGVREGHGTSLVLTIKAPTSVTEPLALLEIYRVVDGGEPEAIQEIVLDDGLKRAIANEIEFVDRDLTPESSLVYVVQGLGDDTVVLSNEWTTTWVEPPPTPHVEPSTEIGIVTLRWKENAYSAVIFRRNVLLTDSAPSRVAEIPAGVTAWSDVNVSPGDVFTYQVAFARVMDDWSLYGRPTEPIYVTIPAK